MERFFLNLTTGIGPNDILDILIMSYIIYRVLGFIKESRAQQLLKGLVVLIILYFLSEFLRLHVLHWVLGGTFTIGIFAIVVLFQPEIRRGLEHVGRSKLNKGILSNEDMKEAKKITDTVSEAVESMSKSKTGALIVFEREISLKEIAETGTKVDSEISAQMLENLFYKGAPLHDGAVIIRGQRIYSAGCVLPLTSRETLNKSLGTRHRAGLGITENSDAVVIIVSEETGVISMARDGELERFLNLKSVEKTLLNLYMPDDRRKSNIFNDIKVKLGGQKDVSK